MGKVRKIPVTFLTVPIFFPAVGKIHFSLVRNYFLSMQNDFQVVLDKFPMTRNDFLMPLYKFLATRDDLRVTRNNFLMYRESRLKRK